MSPTLKAALTPGSVGFLVLCLVLWLVFRFVWPGRGFARVWLMAVAAGYVVLSLPVVANSIAAWLPAAGISGRAQTMAADLVVVFDGDNRVGRVAQAAVEHRRFPAAPVVVLGDGWVADAIVRSGVPPALVMQDAGPPTTMAQVDWLRARRVSRPRERIMVVASRLQMPRVASLIRAAGLDVILTPSAIDDEPPTTGVRRFVPTYIALRVSRDALYEHAALAYYRWRGRIR